MVSFHLNVFGDKNIGLNCQKSTILVPLKYLFSTMMDNARIETIADRLKKIRIDKNVSQDFLAKKLGFTQKAYSKIENNETKLNVEVLQRISEILEIPVESFFTNNNQPILNDFSNRTGGDNVIYKNNSVEKIEELYKKLLDSKDEVIKSKMDEIESLKYLLNHFKG
jgi:transcriptional regulator with XRE-family HTH domain